MSTGAVIGVVAVVAVVGVGAALYMSHKSSERSAQLAALSHSKSAGGGLSLDKIVSTAGSVASVGSKIADLFS